MANEIDILLVDDNEDDIFLLREAMKDAKLLNVIHASKDGIDAMEYLNAQADEDGAGLPGLILLDINMPRMNGFEVLEGIKSDPRLKHIPVVMLTTSDRDQDVLSSYTNGACSFVTKPVDFEKIQDVVKQFALYWTLVAKVPPKG